MKKILLVIFTAFIVVPVFSSCGGGDDNNGITNVPEKEEDKDDNKQEEKSEQPATTAFAKGADISWVTEMEADGKKFYNSAGKETDCFELMKGIGMNAVRLRVWVNPETAAVKDAASGGYGAAYCGKADVVAKAKRAAAAGLDVMIDFHYSDIFADPSRQNTPTKWLGHSLEQLKTDVADHTKDVLNALKTAGVTPKWIQIGNETRNGMLWDTGRWWTDAGNIENGRANFAALANAGYDAAKSVFADALVMVHIDNAYADNDWWFKQYKANGGKFDMIGLSHYPMTSEEYTWGQMNSKAIANIKTLAATYKVKVMVCEVGVKPAQTDAATCMSDFMAKAKALDECAGVFYWEPQVYGSWRPQTYVNVWGWGSYDMGAFTSDGKPSAILDSFK